MTRKIILFALTVFLMSGCNNNHPNTNITNKNKMKLNAGIVTHKLAETKKFYTDILGFGVTFENEFYILLHTPDKAAEISFLLPNHPSQQPLFQQPFMGQGMYLTIEVDDVDQIYKDLKKKGVEIKIDLRDEPWGDRHFAIQDPNGIGIDLVRYSPQAKE
jgi:catechol 2,3-dioxygenase-like lactoylglutathione lyase family enzyme